MLLRLLPVLLSILLLLASCAATGRADAVAPRPPNIVIVFADDLGHGDLGCYGQARWRTPNLDRLAAEGVRFTDFYAAQAVCSASRASLLTGCYPNRIDVTGALGPRARIGLSPDETTIADLCKSRGYATAIFGKWHLGDAPNLLPTHQGFDEYYGIPYSNDMWPLHPDMVKLPPDAAERKRRYPPLPLYENDRIVQAEVTPDDQRRFTHDFTTRACEFIRRNADRPFFLYLPHPMPHVPLFPSEAFTGRSGAGVYGDVIEEIDWSVGEIVAELDRQKVADNTLLVFASDNGPWLSYGDHGGTTGGLREGKGTSWEGGVRVPCIARLPGRIPAGSVCRTPAMTIDLLPSIAELIGAPLPERRIDGVSLWRMLGEEPGAAGDLQARPLAIYYHSNDLEAVRRGRWKLVLPHKYAALAGPPGSGGTPGAYTPKPCGLELYDLEADPGETTDRAAAEPEVVKSLLEAAEEFRADLGDALTTREGSGRREPGKAEGGP